MKIRLTRTPGRINVWDGAGTVSARVTSVAGRCRVMLDSILINGMSRAVGLAAQAQSAAFAEWLAGEHEMPAPAVRRDPYELVAIDRGGEVVRIKDLVTAVGYAGCWRVVGISASRTHAHTDVVLEPHDAAARRYLGEVGVQTLVESPGALYRMGS